VFWGEGTPAVEARRRTNEAGTSPFRSPCDGPDRSWTSENRVHASSLKRPPPELARASETFPTQLQEPRSRGSRILAKRPARCQREGSHASSLSMRGLRSRATTAARDHARSPGLLDPADRIEELPGPAHGKAGTPQEGRRRRRAEGLGRGASRLYWNARQR
jgi:hypothetical protein